MADIVEDEITWAYAADVVKTKETSDGHLMVFGKAAGPDLDDDAQICDPAWLATAMPDWMRWGNIRAQHGPVAAGIGKSLTATDGGNWDLLSKIVDEDSKVKTREGVYKGYSIGIKGARVVTDAAAPKGRIVGGKIVEISLVDRPCNPTAKVSIVKAAGMTDLDGLEYDDAAEYGEETLIPLDVEGKAVQPDEVDADGLDDEGEDINKGFLEFLANKKKPEHGAKGRFAATGRKKKDTALSAREKRVAAREAATKQRAAATARAITEGRVSAEALNDANNALASGRHEEAMSHLSDAALHAHDAGQRGQVRAASLRIGKSAVADGVLTAAEAADLFDDIDEILGADDRPAAPVLTVAQYKAAQRSIRRVLDGEITKAGTIDESADIEAARTVIGEICDLMISELNELKSGRLKELEDVHVLLDAMHSMCRFLECEEDEHGNLGGNWDDDNDEPEDGHGYEDMSDEGLSYVALAAAGELEKRLTADTFKGVVPDVVKRFFSQSKREHLADTGAAMPDGSFPITDQASLDDAVHLAGHGKDPAAAKAHIRKRAKALGLKLPDSWTAEGDDADKAAGPDDDRVAILSAELTKATEAQRTHEEEINTLRVELAKVTDLLTKTAAPAKVALMAPGLIPAQDSVESEAARVRREANRPDLDPSVRAAQLAYAATLEG